MSNMATGVLGESLAKDYLVKQGYEIIETNYRCQAGEIDIIALDAGVLCFVEVKTRTSLKFGLPQDIINHLKLSRMARCIEYYTSEKKVKYELYRIDIVSILLNGTNIQDIDLIRNASLQ